MGASERDAPAPAGPLAASVLPGGWKAALGGAAAVAVLLTVFPLFRVVPLRPPAAAASAGAAAPVAAAPAGFNPATAAAKVWRTDLPAAFSRAVELSRLVPAIRGNAEAAKSQFGQATPLGAGYYFVRGKAKIVAREKNTLRLAPEGAETELIAIRLGPVFGNTVRDGCGLLDVNAFPGLQEFNALSAELNALVEQSVLPALRAQATVGAIVQLVGCAEAPESAADPGEPLLTIVPVQVEVR